MTPDKPSDPEAKKGEALYLAIMQCPSHKFYCVSIETENHGGIRLTSSKCCGRWDTVKRWKVDPAQLIADIEAEAKR